MNDEEDFRLLFDRYVSPHLEYSVQVWSPFEEGCEMPGKSAKNDYKIGKRTLYTDSVYRLPYILGYTFAERHHVLRI